MNPDFFWFLVYEVLTHSVSQSKRFQVDQSDTVVIRAQELKANYLDLIASGQDISFDGE